MFHLLPAGTRLYRVTAPGRTWRDVVSGGGSYFASGGRFNRVQQRTVYAATDPLVAMAEGAAHVALDNWQPRIGRGSLSVQPALPAPVPPLISLHWLWCFTINAGMHLVDVEDPAARRTFNHRLYELMNPSQAYRATADLADKVRLHPHPVAAQAMVDGILAASVRTPPVARYRPRQQVFFVPRHRLTIAATLVSRWRLALEFTDRNGQSVHANTRVIDWANPRFQLSNNPASVPAFPQRPNSQSFAAGTWHRFRVKYT
jgi:hypothetical protein